jgi:hypothetical protein
MADSSNITKLPATPIPFDYYPIGKTTPSEIHVEMHGRLAEKAQELLDNDHEFVISENYHRGFKLAVSKGNQVVNKYDCATLEKMSETAKDLICATYRCIQNMKDMGEG